ncbi:MAG: porphobilinogen synthase [Pseudomonadota bacterium]
MIQKDAAFPNCRMRRLRSSASIRDMVAETSLSASDLIQPYFILEGAHQKEAISSLPGQYRFSIDLLIEEVQQCYDLGICAVALFPVLSPDLKDKNGSEALNPDNLICRAIRALKDAVPDMLLVTDIALDPYTSHGHDGLIDANGYMQNDETIDILIGQSLNQARAGADILAPSDMTDGRIGKIRAELENEKLHNTMLMSYAAKYASHFYGPFRDAVGSNTALKTDKSYYQMDFRNSDEALREIALDLQEGADMIIIKPGMPYLDVIQRAAKAFSVPIFAYQVSGEYAMLHNGAIECGFDRDKIIFESLIAFKRAGCTGILSYFAKEFTQKIK